MKLPCMEAIMGKLKQACPDAFKVFLPRRYIPPQGYCNPQYYAATATSVNGTRRSSNDASTVNLQIVTYGLAEYAVPTYFISPAFTEAVMHIDPPEGMTIDEIKWPMPAMLFVLPVETSRRLFGVPVPFIAISKMKAGANPPPAAIHKLFPVAKEITYGTKWGVAIHAMAVLGADTFDPQPVDFSLAASSGRLLTDVCHDTRFSEEAKADSVSNQINQKFNRTLDDDAKIINKISTFAFSLVLAIMSRPSLIEGPAGQLERPERIKRGVVVQEALWNANMIGRNYKLAGAQQPGDGSHASPRMHWRRGHYRNQPCGPGRMEINRILIDPVMVNAEQE